MKNSFLILLFTLFPILSVAYPTVICDGALPRKTFSMGHAWDKRYYIEARKITE